MAAKDFDFVFQPFHTLDLVELPIYDKPLETSLYYWPQATINFDKIFVTCI